MDCEVFKSAKNYINVKLYIVKCLMLGHFEGTRFAFCNSVSLYLLIL